MAEGAARTAEPRASFPLETVVPRGQRTKLWWEVAIVLGLSLGQSAVYSILTIVQRLAAPTPLKDQSAEVNQSQSPTPWLDFTYQALDIVFALMAVALVIYLLWRPQQTGFRRIGLDWSRPWRDLGSGALLFAVIGVPGLGFYALSRVFGITVSVGTWPDPSYWWTAGMLLLSAVRAALQEEVIMIGYLFARLKQLGWNSWWVIIASALVRGSYHLYQGIGPFFGNAVMGVVFGWCYRRWGRTAPLVVAHSLLDIVSFIGYPIAVALWPGVFGQTKS
ncbi:CPBP family intramembrane metalloprotease [Planctomonas sp. JC2975]|uniref:CPBP family intramembrane glutamic endopeptidase n=1 Tax=Planctomonas sp. JC2975 TaxID=2729626 RepID=UPI0014744DCE|nr:CPBP family intramembrane glutamic endopeptidase [Planctomonas sp. JC2975]NNC11219.1 CPBP family intramembrane metalloprotease [Planctomonas sp. JC2975]